MGLGEHKPAGQDGAGEPCSQLLPAALLVVATLPLHGLFFIAPALPFLSHASVPARAHALGCGCVTPENFRVCAFYPWDSVECGVNRLPIVADTSTMRRKLRFYGCTLFWPLRQPRRGPRPSKNSEKQQGRLRRAGGKTGRGSGHADGRHWQLCQQGAPFFGRVASRRLVRLSCSLSPLSSGSAGEEGFRLAQSLLGGKEVAWSRLLSAQRLGLVSGLSSCCRFSAVGEDETPEDGGLLLTVTVEGWGGEPVGMRLVCVVTTQQRVGVANQGAVLQAAGRAQELAALLSLLTDAYHV